MPITPRTVLLLHGRARATVQAFITFESRLLRLNVNRPDYGLLTTEEVTQLNDITANLVDKLSERVPVRG